MKTLLEQPDLLKLPKRTTVVQLVMHEVQVKVLYACVLSELLRAKRYKLYFFAESYNM